MVTFNDWFSANYDKVKQRFSLSPWFNEDVFHDAYISANESTKNLYAFRNFSEKESDKVYYSIFISAYKAQNKMHYSGKANEIHPTNFVWGLLTANMIDDDGLGSTDKGKLIANIKTFAKRTFSKEDFRLFEAYFIHSFGLKNSSEFCGKSIGWTFSHVSNIRNILCKQFDTELYNLK